MGYVTSEQISRARQYPVLNYVLTYESNNVKRVGSGYRLKDHESIAISDKGFYWHSKGIGGKTALDFLTEIRGYGLLTNARKTFITNGSNRLITKTL